MGMVPFEYPFYLKLIAEKSTSVLNLASHPLGGKSEKFQ